MKLKSIYKYLIWQQGKSYLIYFGIIFVIVHLGLLLTLSIDTNGSFGGMEMGTVIFMMISGIVFYRESLALSMQNGISRKTFFMALILGFITISVLAAAGDSIIMNTLHIYIWKNTLKCFMIQCMNKCIFINPELVLAQKFQNTLQYF